MYTLDDFTASQIQIEIKNKIAIIEMNEDALFDPHVNEVVRGFCGLFDAIADDESIPVVMLKMKSDSAVFSAFVSCYKEQNNFYLQIPRTINGINNIVCAIIDSPKWVIAFHEGSFHSPYLDISLACDLRLASESTIYHNNFLKHQIITHGIGYYLLLKMLGREATLRLLTAGQEISADVACEMGLVDQLVSSQNFYKDCFEIAQKYANYSPQLLIGNKKLLNYAYRDIREFLVYQEKSLSFLRNKLHSDLLRDSKLFDVQY